MKSIITAEPRFWNMNAGDVLTHFQSDEKQGVTETEAHKRLAAYGPNTIRIGTSNSWMRIFVRQFSNPLILILLAAVGVTVAISHYRDAIFILVAVLVNTALGFYQESKAEKALAELRTYLKQRARIVRNSVEQTIDAEMIVPGDIIRISQGDRIPADARIIYSNDFQADEAVLTGESLPVTKSVPAVSADTMGDQRSMLFAGTLATQGVCTAVVCRTGASTELGKIASLIARVENERTPLQSAIQRFSIRSSMFLGALTVAVFVIGIGAGYSYIDMFLTSVAIAVSAIPEGLPVAMTVILAVGVERMAKRKGVVRKLIAAETLGDTTLILTDKTGTLTMASMEFARTISLSGLDESALFRRAILNTSVLIENPSDTPQTWRMDGKIMERAVIKAAAEIGISSTDLLDKSAVIQSLPFNADNKFSVSLMRQQDGSHILIFFGAPDVLLRHASLVTHDRHQLLERIAFMARSGERILGVASKQIESAEDFSFTRDLKTHLSELTVDGLISFRDPVRPAAKESIRQITNAGVKTIIMTGDHRGTAEAVAEELGMQLGPESVLDASELINLDDEALAKRLPQLKVISRVSPFDKLRIAKLFQAAGEVVAMTGDGVNDAPAIRQADVGIAMGSGTEVSRSVADLVLLDDNFETIVAAIEEGRQIRSNIRKVLVYLLSNVTDGLILIGGSLLAGLTLPLNALQILWVNFFSDSFPAIAFAFEREPGRLSLVTKATRTSRHTIFDPLMRFLILTIGLSTSAMLFGLYWILLHLGYPPEIVRTFIYASFGTYTLFVALSVRSLEKHLFAYSLLSNRYMIGGIGVGLILMIASIYVPFLQTLFDTVALPPEWVAAVLAVGAVNMAMIELGKWIFRKWPSGMRYNGAN